MRTDPDHAVYAEGLVKRFGTTTALDGVDLAVRTGTVLGVLGPNGAGKTTAVRVLATLLRPDAGFARVAGYDVVRDSGQVRQLIGLTGQFASVDEELTGRQNLVMIARLLGARQRAARAKADELLERFTLAEAGGRQAKTYSGGMRRRLDLAASLVGEPRIVFLDEPTTGLDPRTRNAVWDTVRERVAAGVTVLLTTQYLEEADQLADEIAVFDHGRVVATGTSAQLKVAVGGQTLAVRPADAADAPKASQVLAEIVGEPTATPDGLLSVPVPDGSSMPSVVRRLDELGITVTELSLRLPSLDDAFLRLTGHDTSELDSSTSESTDNTSAQSKGIQR